MQGIKTAVFPSNLIFQTAQQLRQRTRQRTNTLDINRTLQASLKKGGWFTPVYGYRQITPEYLFLIDRASYADHQAQLTDALIQQLQQNGVYITRYFFDGDAQICYPEVQTNSPQPLQALANQYGTDRLVVIADAETLYSHHTGEPEPWLEQIQAWQQRAILTPKPVESWSQWEFTLVQQFIVLPLNPQGIAALSQVFRNGSATYRSVDAFPTPFPKMLSMRPRRWLERHPPAPEEGQQMLVELTNYLGETGLYWFAACAVFPELHWNITVYLGNVLKNPEGHSLLDSYPLSNLVRLPWFRYGYIPDWLRRYLVVNLTPDQNKTVRNAFQQLMVTAVKGAVGPLQLDIAQRYQHYLPNLTNPLLRLLTRQATEEAPLRDYIFLDFMAQKSLLAVTIPEDIQPLLQGSRYEKVLWRQKLVLAVVVSWAITTIGLNTWWVFMAQTRRMNQLLQVTQTLTAENSRLEALVALTRVGQMLRASNTQNASVLSAATNLFLELVPTRDNNVLSNSSEFREYNQLDGHGASVWSVSFSPDGQTLASASDDRTVKLWSRDGTLLQTLAGHGDWVRSVSFSPDSQTLASASEDRTVKLWSRDGTLLQTLAGHGDRVWSVSFSPDGQTIASASSDGTVKLWSRDGTLLQTLAGHGFSVWSVSFSPDGQTIASASDDRTVKLWSRDGTLLQTLEGHGASVRSVSFSPDGQTIASASDDRTVKLWSRDGTLLQTLAGHGSWVRSVSFSLDGQTIASASADRTVKLWSRDGTLLQTLAGHGFSVWSVSFSPDGQTIASASSDRTVKLWSRDGTLLQTLEGHGSWVWSVSFSPDGQTIASASDDRTVKLWSRDGTLLQTLAGHGASVRSVSFSPDGQTI
ncbi:MAG: hypothetical protein F6K19_18655, partial [Cyanothece sp. SIO1E1]|nr:hypothetical protein [Cyanothece sp. SIO1E1]